MAPRVLDRYVKADVQIPADVKRVFGIDANTNNKAVNVGGRFEQPPTITYNRRIGRDGKQKGLKIGKRQCKRIPKQMLVDTLLRMGIQPPKRSTVPSLCQVLSTKMTNNNNRRNNANFNNLVNYARQLTANR